MYILYKFSSFMAFCQAAPKKFPLEIYFNMSKMNYGRFFQQALTFLFCCIKI